ncbi:MAG: hypothetical protein IPG87_09820 [Saprospiraceae bacterium]|nr:hypothetical protein [Candidatus Vicinibacter affinis]
MKPQVTIQELQQLIKELVLSQKETEKLLRKRIESFGKLTAKSIKPFTSSKVSGVSL